MTHSAAELTERRDQLRTHVIPTNVFDIFANDTTEHDNVCKRNTTLQSQQMQIAESKWNNEIYTAK